MIKTLLTLYLPDNTLRKEVMMPYRIKKSDEFIIDGAHDTYSLTVESDGCYDLVREFLFVDVELPDVFTKTERDRKEVISDFEALGWTQTTHAD